MRNPVAQPSESVALATAQETVDETATRGEGVLEQPSIVKTEEARDTGMQAKDQQVKPEPLDTAVQVGDGQAKNDTAGMVDLVQEQPKADLQIPEKPQNEIKPSIEQPGDTGTQPAADGQQADKLQDGTTKDLEPLDTLDTNDDMTYESLFGAKSANDDNQDLNLYDFDFGTDNAAADGQDQGQDFSMQNDGHIDLSTFGETTDQPFGNDDGSSMLQGLESYANQVPEEGGDINMLDTANTGGNAGADGGGIINLDGGDGVGMSSADLDLALDIGGNETNFDDLLDGLDFEGGDDTAGLENQEFDDAYFRIGDS